MVSLKELVLAGALALGSAIGYSAEPPGIDPKVAYDALYGDKEKKANASSKPEDKFEFGKLLYEDSKSKDKAQLEELLEDKAIEFLEASRKVEAYPLIIAIHKDDAQDFPDKKVDYQQKVLKVLDQYKNNLPYGEARKSVDMQIAAETVVLANYFMDDEKYNEAEVTFRDASYKAGTAQMKDAQKLADEGQVLSRKLREEQGNIALAVQRADKGDKLSCLMVGKYHLSKGEMEKAEQYLSKSDDKKYTGFLDALKTSGAESIKETPRGVTEADVKRFEDSVKAKDNKRIYDALQKLEVEPAIRFDCQIAEAMIDKNRTENLEKKLAEITVQLPDLMKTAKTGQINANNHMIIATQYKELGDEVLANKRKIFCLEKAVNEYAIVANASTDNLAKLTAKGLQDKLTVQLAELGKQVTIDVPALAQGKMWDFDTDENCLDFTKNWYTPENKDKPGFGWTKVGPKNYTCGGWEIKDGELNHTYIGDNSKGNILFNVNSFSRCNLSLQFEPKSGNLDLDFVLQVPPSKEIWKEYLIAFQSKRFWVGYEKVDFTIFEKKFSEVFFNKTKYKFEANYDGNQLFFRRNKDPIITYKIEKNKKNYFLGIFCWRTSATFDDISFSLD